MARKTIAKGNVGSSVKRSAKVAPKGKAKVAAKAKGKGKAKGKAKVAREAAPQVKFGVGIAFGDDTRITVKATKNPKRGDSAKRFDAYLKRKPKTVAAALAAGLTRGDLRYDHGKGFIVLSGPGFTAA